jgi:AraC family transcriptional regulator
MGWLERMSEAMNYIEENLPGEVDLSKVARITCQSLSGFQRFFSTVTDISLSEYIRRRRLTMAAMELNNSDIKIIDLALKYGYDSPEAFARAFGSLHGVSPSAARMMGVHLKAYPRLSFLLTLKGDVPMDYRTETRDAFHVYGIEGIFTAENGENFRAIPRFWQDVMEDGRFEKLLSSIPEEPASKDGLCPVNAICSYRETGGATFPYMIFAFQKNGSRTDGFQTALVPAATWAIFKSDRYSIEDTSKAVQGLNHRVFTEWLPNAPFEMVDGCDLELYYGEKDNCYSEIWIRVKPKA